MGIKNPKKDEVVFRPPTIEDDIVRVIHIGSIIISKPKTPFVEDLEYLIKDFGKLKSRLRFEKLSDETKDALFDAYEEKLTRFLKRYKDR